jgi:CBS domain-containing protein
MSVARILKDKGRAVVTALPNTPMQEIVRHLVSKGIGALVVCEKDGHIVGIISERDIVRVLAVNGAAMLEQPVSAHMTKDVVTCTERDTVNRLMEEMTSHRFRHLPVVDGGKLVGIVSIGDVVKLRLAVVEMEAASMRDYIKTG